VSFMADFISCAKPTQKNSYFKSFVLGKESGDFRVDGLFGGHVGFPVAALDELFDLSRDDFLFRFRLLFAYLVFIVHKPILLQGSRSQGGFVNALKTHRSFRPQNISGGRSIRF